MRAAATGSAALASTECVLIAMTGTKRVRLCQKVSADVSVIHLEPGPAGDRFQ